MRSVAPPPQSGLKDVRSFCGLSWSDSLHTVNYSCLPCTLDTEQPDAGSSSYAASQRSQSSFTVPERPFVLCRRQLLRAYIIIQSTMSTEIPIT